MIIIFLIGLGIYFYILKKIIGYEKLYKKKVSIRNIDREKLVEFNGDILIVNDKEFINRMEYYFKEYKRYGKNGDFIVIEYEDELNDEDVNLLTSIGVEYLPCIRIKSKKGDEYELIKLGEYK